MTETEELPAPEELEEETPEGAAPAPKPEASDKDLKSELAALRAQLNEVRASERMWAEKALGAANKPKDAEPVQDLSGEQLLDLIERDGLKGLKALGFVSAKEATELVQRAVEQATAPSSKANLMREYPDLKNPKSEFYQQVNELLSSDEFSDIQGPGAIRLAAKQVAEAMKSKSTTSRNDINSRLGAQSGTREGAPAPASRGITATQEQLEMAARLGVTPKQLMEELKAK